MGGIAGAADVKALLGQSVPQARQMLRKVLVGRLPCQGFAEAGQRGYRFKGNGTSGRLLAGIASVTSYGDPGGIRTRDLDLERVARSPLTTRPMV